MMCQYEKELQLPFYLVDITEAATDEEIKLFIISCRIMILTKCKHVLFCNYNVSREIEDACKLSLPSGTIIFMSLCWHELSLDLKICGFLDSSLCPVVYRSNMFSTQSVKSVLHSQDTFLLMWQLFISCTAQIF